MAPLLERKYPFELNGSPTKEALLAFLIVFLILFLLQPFGISEYEGSRFLICLAFGLVTFVCSMAMDFFIALPLQKRAKPWRIWHQALAVFVEILIIGLCNFLLASLVFNYPLEWASCLEMVYWTIIIGLVYAGLSTTFSYPPSAAAPKIFFRYYLVNGATGEKSSTMLAECKWTAGE